MDIGTRAERGLRLAAGVRARDCALRDGNDAAAGVLERQLNAHARDAHEVIAVRKFVSLQTKRLTDQAFEAVSRNGIALASPDGHAQAGVVEFVGHRINHQKAISRRMSAAEDARKRLAP